ncbi:Reverse transcriptase domain-containing protein [Aphis craccivora]|uniref:Reverse transcriptase domain-containing protein n=1 Tax=Aphis craccivora TaxID=307492 RepID=A0A6G0VUP9_APHCR|nr:Reverse transcriptase domain-containing protein [Aphis craccivora]
MSPLKSCNNVMAKLAWGCHNNVLRTTALALVQSGPLRQYGYPPFRIKSLPDLRRLSQTTEILHKLKTQPLLLLQIDILEHPPLRLKSRAPIWNAETQSESSLAGITQGLLWITLNRIRSEQRRCNYLLHKWGTVDSPLCECGETRRQSNTILT